MAVVTVKSQQITDRDATPKVISNARVNGAPVQHARGVVTVTATNDIGSKYLVASIPSNAVPVSLRLTGADIGAGAAAADIGLYRSTADGGAVVDADFFASAFSLAGGPFSKSEQLFESGVITVANSETKAIWQHLGLSADPNVMYDIVLTLTGAADATGAEMVEVDYTQ